MRATLGVNKTLLVMALAVGVPSTGWAEPPRSPASRAPLSSADRDEARLRFDRGLTLYNGGDEMGALVEFKRAYELSGHPVVLYNLALVHAALGQSVEAVTALETLQKGGMAELGPKRRARAEAVYAEQLTRVGELEVRVNVEAILQIDNVDVARTPAPPLRLTAGTHLLSVLAPGSEPRRIRVTVAGGARETVDIELVPIEGSLARLQVTTDVPDVTLRAGGEVIGTTPFAASLAFKPGVYELAFEREGYQPAKRRVVLHQGSEGKLHVALEPSEAGLAQGGRLMMSLSEQSAVVTVDGKPRIDHNLGLQLPVGRHLLRVERDGFFPIERELRIAPGENRLKLELLPTPGYLGNYVDEAQSQRTWSYLTFGAGALLAFGGTGFLIWNQGEKEDAEREFDRTADEAASGCSAACEEELRILLADLVEKRDRDAYGWIGVGIGAAAMSAGALLYLLGDDPARYDPDPESDVFGSLELTIGARGAALSGRF